MGRVLITGGAGFIGSHAADRFQKDGAQVLVIDDLSSGSPENVSEGIELVEADIRSEKARQTVKDFNPDVLVHAAAQMSVTESMKDPHFDADVNIVGLVNLLEAHKESDSKPYVVFISTGGALYGEQDVYPAPEDHPIRPESFYGLAKRVGEMYLDLWARSYGLKYGVLRLSNVYGPRQNPHGEAGVVAIFNNKILQGTQPTIFGDGEQTRDYIFVGDVVEAMATVVSSQVTGTFNIGTGVETTVNQLLAGITSSLDSSVEAEYAAGRAGEQRRSVVDPSHARETLSWKAEKSLQEGLGLTCEWFKQQHAKG